MIHFGDDLSSLVSNLVVHFAFLSLYLDRLRLISFGSWEIPLTHFKATLSHVRVPNINFFDSASQEILTTVCYSQQHNVKKSFFHFSPTSFHFLFPQIHISFAYLGRKAWAENSWTFRLFCCFCIDLIVKPVKQATRMAFPYKARAIRVNV